MKYSGDSDARPAPGRNQSGSHKSGKIGFAGEQDKRPMCGRDQGSYIKPQKGTRTSGSSKKGRG